MKDMNMNTQESEQCNKYDELQESYTETHYNKALKNRESLERCRKEATLHIQEILSKIISSVLIKKFGDKGVVSIFKR